MDRRLTFRLVVALWGSNSKPRLNPTVLVDMTLSWPTKLCPATRLANGSTGPAGFLTLATTGALTPPKCLCLRPVPFGPVTTFVRLTFILLYVSNRLPAMPTLGLSMEEPVTLLRTNFGPSIAIVAVLALTFLGGVSMVAVVSRRQTMIKFMSTLAGAANAWASPSTRSTAIGLSAIESS
jgi:hypothetical protein